MRCRDCQAEVEHEKAIAGLCDACFFAKVGTIRSIPKERYREAKSAIESEAAGLLPWTGLRTILEGFYDAVAGGAQLDRAIEEHGLMIQRLAALGACREMLRFSDALAELAQTWENDVRERIGKLAKIGEPP